MATKTPRQHIDDPNGQVEGYIWENCTGNTGTDTFVAQRVNKDDITFSASGTFDSATVTLTGSNDGVNYHSVIDLVTAAAMSLTAAGAAVGAQTFIWYKPVVTGGSQATQDLDLVLVVK